MLIDQSAALRQSLNEVQVELRAIRLDQLGARARDRLGVPATPNSELDDLRKQRDAALPDQGRDICSFQLTDSPDETAGTLVTAVDQVPIGTLAGRPGRIGNVDAIAARRRLLGTCWPGITLGTRRGQAGLGYHRRPLGGRR